MPFNSKVAAGTSLITRGVPVAGRTRAMTAARLKSLRIKANPKQSTKRNRNRRPNAKKRRKSAKRSSYEFLELEPLQIAAKLLAKFIVFQSDLHRGFQKPQLIACVVGFALIFKRGEAMLLNEQSQPIGKLNLASASGRSSLQAVEYFRRQNVAACYCEIWRRLSRFPFFHQIAYAN